MTPADYAIIGGTAVSAFVALGGVVAYFHRTNESIIERCEKRMEARVAEVVVQHRADITRLEEALVTERQDRRREIDRMERTLEGFADVASAVVAMGKSIEHVAERQNDHQAQYREDMTELKESIRSIENKIMDAAIKGR